MINQLLSCVGVLHDAGDKEKKKMIDAVIKDQKTGKPVISQTFRSIREVKRWIDKEYRHKPEESGMWITLLFKDNSEQPFYENVRF